MTKHIFTNKRLVEVWAAQTQDWGKNPKGSLFFEGRIIYSYSKEWPIAIMPNSPQGTVFINSENKSPITSRQTLTVTAHFASYIKVSHKVLQALLTSRGL